MRYKPAYINNYNMLLLLGLLVIGTLLLGRIFGYLLVNLSKGLDTGSYDSSLYGIPIAAGAMFVTLLFDFHTAIIFSFTISLLTGLWLQDASFYRSIPSQAASLRPSASSGARRGLPC